MVQTEAGDVPSVAFDSIGTHGKVAGHSIFPGCQFYQIEMGVFRRPEMRIREGNRETGSERGTTDNTLPVLVDPVLNKTDSRFVRSDGEGQIKADGFCIDVRRYLEVSDICIGHPFQPHGLPQSALGSVEHAVRAQALFPPAVIGLVCKVLNAHGERIFPFFQIFRDICLKWKISAHMPAGLPAVQ